MVSEGTWEKMIKKLLIHPNISAWLRDRDAFKLISADCQIKKSKYKNVLYLSIRGLQHLSFFLLKCNLVFSSLWFSKKLVSCRTMTINLDSKLWLRCLSLSFWKPRAAPVFDPWRGWFNLPSDGDGDGEKSETERGSGERGRQRCQFEATITPWQVPHIGWWRWIWNTHAHRRTHERPLSLCVCACLGERGQDKRVQSFIFILKFDLACLIYQVVIFVAGSCHSSMNILVKLLSWVKHKNLFFWN